MKKQIKLLLTIILVFILATGCAKSTSKNEDNTNEPLKVAMDLKYPPFTSMDEKGNPQGLEVDIAKALGEYLGRQVEIINTDFSMLIPALETGEVDIVISDMSIKEERKEKVDFSTPYLYSRTLALVNKDFAQKNNISEMTEEEFFAISDAKFVGLAGTISVSVPQSYGVDVKEITEIAPGLMEVSKGTSDVLVGANTIIGDHYAYENTTEIYWGIKQYSQSAMAVKKGNTELLEKANEFIKTMYEPGGFYMEAGNKYDKAIGEYLKDPSLGLEYKIYPPVE